MPVIEFPLIGPHYTNREKGLSSQVTKNMFPQIDPEARNQVSLHSTAGLKTFATLGGADRGMHDFNNIMYCVSGTSLYSVDANGIDSNLGTIAGKARCVMANDPTQLMIATGGTLYRYTVADGVQAVTDDNITNPESISYLNSQFILDNNAGTFGAFATSSIDEVFSIDALDYATAEGHPDDIIRVLTFRQLVYLYGSHSTEPWQNTGVGNPPFARVRGGVQPYGLAGTHAIVSTPEYMYFLDNQRIPRRSSGLEFTNIGNPALGVEFAKYSRISDCIAYQFTQDHQQFFALTFPTANRTWCFHEPTGTWFQLSYGIDDDRHRASSMLNIYGLNYCADHSNGKIYEYSLDIYSDDGVAIINQRDTASLNGYLLGVPGAKIYIDEVEFIIVSGATEVAGTGLGPQPIIINTGICGTSDDLSQGELLGVHLQRGSPDTVTGNSIEASGTSELGTSFNNSKEFSFTTFFRRQNSPDSGFTTGLWDMQNLTTNTSNLSFYMDSNGYMNIVGRNTAGTTILDVQITNNGSTFADLVVHEFAAAMDLSDSTKREIYHNGTNITDSSWVTWTTYTDDELGLADVAGAPGPDLHYCWGFIYVAGSGFAWGATGSRNGVNANSEITDSYSYMTFDDSCSLVCSAVWDGSTVRDPQKWEGWYITQPRVFFANSFHKNSGSSAPTTYEGNDFEMNWSLALPSAVTSNHFDSTNRINSGLGGDYLATGGSLPDAPGSEPQTEIVANFWENTGNWIDLSKLSQTTYNGLFGVDIEGADFNSVFAVNTAILVNTADAGNRLQIQSSSDASVGVMYITDISGNVVDTAAFPSGNSVLVPTNGTYYIVISTDTGNAKIRKWDTTTVSTAGSVSWESFFGREFPTSGIVTSQVLKIIPQDGISIAFTVPTGVTGTIRFDHIEYPFVQTSVTASINQTVGDYTSEPSENPYRLGGFMVGGINYPGTDIDLIPGETYFYNTRNNQPSATNNYIHIRARYDER